MKLAHFVNSLPKTTVIIVCTTILLNHNIYANFRERDLIKISNSYNCGSIASYLFLVSCGSSVDFDWVRSRFGEDSSVSSFKLIIQILNEAGIKAYGVHCDLGWLKKHTPAIIARKTGASKEIGHFSFVLYDKKNNKFLIAEPEHKDTLHDISDSDLESTFTGNAVASH